MTAMFRAARNRTLGLAVLTTVVAVPAAAQTPGDSARGLSLEEIDNGWVVAPDFRFTEIDDEATTVAGAYGGYLLDRRLLIGAGAYWLDSDLTELSYFGPLVEWSTKTGGRFDLSVRALVGLGSATRYGDFGAFVDHDALGDTHAQHGADVSALSFPGRSGRGFGRGFRWGDRFGGFGSYDEFVVAEPHVSLLTRVTDWFGVNVGVGYRATGDDFDLGDSLSGASFSLGFRFGPS
jgi:hypothetical protein